MLSLTSSGRPSSVGVPYSGFGSVGGGWFSVLALGVVLERSSSLVRLFRLRLAPSVPGQQEHSAVLL
jgi:hypothetical protein